MGLYLCYDIRGIQSFIFRIPKLKYIIGGSALIDRFDRETARNMPCDGAEFLCSGGGKGTYRCRDANAADRLQRELTQRAHEIGVDIRFGRGEEFAEVSREALELYPFEPDQIDGPPCPESGLYPVAEGMTVHPVVRKRIFDKDKPMFRHFEHRLKTNNISLPGVDPSQMAFFHNVSADDDTDQQGGRLGAEALGGRNRWAVIYMDGNDMGMQLTAMRDRKDVSEEEMTRWVAEMSLALDACSEEATIRGIQRVVSEWAAKDDFDPKGKDHVVLPVRPIVVGGDDIVILCHVAHAMTFVKEAMRVFRTTSVQRQQEATIELWPATGGEISISAGVLYCPVTLPLHTAIDYAESLLASAKAGGRRHKDPNRKGPSPESVDWEQITDSIVDTPAARRQRELIFEDADNGETIVKLTTRPCTLEKYEEIEKLSKRYEKCPVSIRHLVLRGLRQGFSDRLAFVAEIAKHQPKLAADITEEGFEFKKKPPRWKYTEQDNKRVQETDVLDALLILEEKQRMERETING